MKTEHTHDAPRRLRGVEAALHIWARVENGALISEELRALGDRVSAADRTLAASLCYAAARRLSLWQHLRERFMLPKPSKFTRAAQTAVLCGTAGLLELKNFAPAVLISSLIDWTKVRDPRGARVVNAVLRRVLEEGPAELERLQKEPGLGSRCLLCGVPEWIAREWCDSYGEQAAAELVEMNAGAPSLSLRLSPDAPRDLPAQIEQAGCTVSDSPLPEGLRVNGTPLPNLLPGYAEGWFAPQSESSITAGNEAADFDGRFLLDMCAGRGVKTGQIAQLRSDIEIEAWDLSQGRTMAGEREMERLRVSSRVHYKSGDALELAPLHVPDAILVDAPCSGSGTWRRHPEGKWRLSPEALDELCTLQERLLERACSLVKAGGKVVYSTCSLLACENERVVRAVLGRHPEMREQPAAEVDAMTPRACGSAILPADPWTDGFYLAVLHKEPN